MEDPCWLVDEMLGRLARYLRFLGYDTAYVQDANDDEIVAEVTRSKRRLITRDRALAMRLPDAILLSRTDIRGQFTELRQNFPALRLEVRFDRCSVCNGLLERAVLASEDLQNEQLPPEVRASRTPLYLCSRCGHRYWEGSHTWSVRRRLAGWASGAPDSG